MEIDMYFVASFTDLVAFKALRLIVVIIIIIVVVPIVAEIFVEG